MHDQMEEKMKSRPTLMYWAEMLTNCVAIKWLLKSETQQSPVDLWQAWRAQAQQSQSLHQIYKGTDKGLSSRTQGA